MSKKPPVEDTFTVPPPLNQAASTNDLMALIHSKQEKIKQLEVVPVGTVPTHTVSNGTVPDRLASSDSSFHQSTVSNVEQAKSLAPWELANEKVPVGFNLRMDQVLHAKALWLCQNLPAMSQQKLYRQAIEEKIDALLKKHYKG